MTILSTIRSEIIAASSADELEALEAEICDRLAIARGTYATSLRALLASVRRRLDGEPVEAILGAE